MVGSELSPANFSSEPSASIIARLEGGGPAHYTVMPLTIDFEGK